MIIILIIIYAQVFFLEKELAEMPFLTLSDLYFDTSNNIFINSNYFNTYLTLKAKLRPGSGRFRSE